jgi:hypothetical protein
LFDELSFRLHHQEANLKLHLLRFLLFHNQLLQINCHPINNIFQLLTYTSSYLTPCDSIAVLKKYLDNDQKKLFPNIRSIIVHVTVLLSSSKIKLHPYTLKKFVNLIWINHYFKLTTNCPSSSITPSGLSGKYSTFPLKY